MSERNPFSIEAYQIQMMEHLNISMQQQAEPLIQKCLVDIEKKLRREVATFVLAQVDSTFSVEQMSENIVITVRGFGKC